MKVKYYEDIEIEKNRKSVFLAGEREKTLGLPMFQLRFRQREAAMSGLKKFRTKNIKI